VYTLLYEYNDEENATLSQRVSVRASLVCQRWIEEDNERKNGNPQASGTIRLRDSLNAVLSMGGGMNDTHLRDTAK